jgi:hypothetical protein
MKYPAQNYASVCSRGFAAILESLKFTGMIVLFLGVWSSTAHAADVIYRETFGNNSAGNLRFDQINTSWKIYTGSTATDETASRQVVAPAASAPSGGLDNVGTGQASLNTTTGLAYMSGGTPGSPLTGLFVTTGLDVSTSLYSGITFSWYAGNNRTDIVQRLAVQIGSFWYVTDQAFTTTAVASASTFQADAQIQSFTFVTTGSAWRDLAFTAGSSLVAGSIARTLDLSSANITGFGLYVENSGTARFDTFSISAAAIPEPASYALLTGAGLLFITGCQRRRI